MPDVSSAVLVRAIRDARRRGEIRSASAVVAARVRARVGVHELQRQIIRLNCVRFDVEAAARGEELPF